MHPEQIQAEMGDWMGGGHLLYYYVCHANYKELT